MQKIILIALLVGSCGVRAAEQSADTDLEADYEASSQPLVDHPPRYEEELEKVYVENGAPTSSSYHSKNDQETCFYSTEHDHLHCYSNEIASVDRTVTQVERQVVVIDERPTRYVRTNPISQGLGIGLAIGLPIAIHHASYSHHDNHRRYNKRYRHNRYYGHYSNGYGKHRYKYRRGHH